MINFRRLQRVCNLPIKNFRGMGAYNAEGRYVLISRPNSTMLAVAHLDTVRQETTFRWDKRNVYSPRLDNRLGAYIIIDLLPKYLESMGIDATYDILLTEDEEMGNSTAQYFKTDKKYNFMFSFDRTGEDVVMYQYENARDKERLVSAGFSVGHGSYSDIAELDTLQIAGFNVGCGMTNYHSVSSYAPIKTILKNVHKWAEFIGQHAATEMPVEAVSRYSRYSAGYYTKWDDDYRYTGSYSFGKIANKLGQTSNILVTYKGDDSDFCPNCGLMWYEHDDTHPYSPAADLYSCKKKMQHYNRSLYLDNPCPDCGSAPLSYNGHEFNSTNTMYRCTVNDVQQEPEGVDTCPYCGDGVTEIDIDFLDKYQMCKACVNTVIRDDDGEEKIEAWVRAWSGKGQ